MFLLNFSIHWSIISEIAMCWIVDRMMVVKFVGDEDDGRVTCIFEAKKNLHGLLFFPPWVRFLSPGQRDFSKAYSFPKCNDDKVLCP